MNDGYPTSQHQIAAKLGLSQATVSMALAGSPLISSAVRERVIAAAKEMGYHPDPNLRSLARYRRSTRAPSFHSTLAWVHNLRSENWWQQSAVYRSVFDAASARAEELGYRLENFWIDPSSCLSPRRATEILVSRGIRGLILLPTFEISPPIKLDWEHFTTVRFFDHLPASPNLHLVAADHYAAMHTVFDELLRRGYERPALLTSARMEHITLGQYSAAYLGMMRRLGHTDVPEIFYFDGLTRTKFDRWFRKNKPDCLVLAYVSEHLEEMAAILKAPQYQPPRKVGVAMLCLPDLDFHKVKLPDFSGIDECPPETGRRLIDLLTSLVENFQRGVLPSLFRHLIGGRWHEGKTLRPPKEIRKSK